MKKFINYLAELKKILLMTFIVFLIFDLILGKFLYKKFLRKDFIDTYDKAYIGSIYDHTHDKNLDVFTGNIRWRLCTDSNGFRVFCNNKLNKKKFDIAVIGDSYAAGVGLKYEETFVGIFSEKIGVDKVANLGVASYSPSIYYII
jgi:hypothetical protein